MADKSDLQINSFASLKEWEQWLIQNHAQSKGIWLRLFKKDSGIASINHDEALLEALCYGWIDGQAKKYDEQSWLQKFCPRGPKSIWSKRNTEHITRLEKEGRMHAAGRQAVAAAKADGRWGKAYSPPSEMAMPEDFLKALAKDKSAKVFFESLNKANTYAIAWRLQTAKKPETREKRMKAILAMLSRGEKFH